MKPGAMNNWKSVRKYKFPIATILLLSGLFLFRSCERLDLKREFMYANGEPVVRTINSAIVSASIYDVGDKGIVQHGHCWSTLGNPSLEFGYRTELGGINSGRAYQSLLTDLTPNSKYYVRSYVSDNSGNTYYGDEIEFVTLPENPGWPNTPDAIAHYTSDEIVLDGNNNEAAWTKGTPIYCSHKYGITIDDWSDTDFSAYFRALFNDEGLLLFVKVTDDHIIRYSDIASKGGTTYQADNIEVYLHSGNRSGDGVYVANNSFQIRFNPYSWEGPYYLYGLTGSGGRTMDEVFEKVEAAIVPTEKGYNAEVFISWDIFDLKPEILLYFEMHVTDADDADEFRECKMMWNYGNDDAWLNTNNFGRMLLYRQNP